ncbi:MAG: DUF2799 domain-containing protein [Hyphomonadaceae bacterium]|nr:DUF2799 domain-containing protein [Hyphomonadaceae bacterium]
MNLRTMFVVGALAFAGVLAGCETMSAEECAVADWRYLGFSDASANGSDRFGARAESCGEKGFAADARAYAAGFAEGMHQFCQPSNAFNYALRGSTFNGACPAELQGNFFAAYGDGRRIYEARYELEQARNRLTVIPGEIEDIDDDIRAKLDSVRGQPQADRERIQREVDDLRRERRELVEERRDLDARLVYLERRINDLRYEIGNRWAPW